MDNVEYLTDVALAERLTIGRSTVWHWSAEGLLPKPIKIGGRLSRWKWNEVVAFLDEKGSSK